MKEIDKMNLNRYKSNSESYDKLIKKIVMALPSEILIKELKRRKLLKINWLNKEYQEVNMHQQTKLQGEVAKPKVRDLHSAGKQDKTVGASKLKTKWGRSYAT